MYEIGRTQVFVFIYGNIEKVLESAPNKGESARDSLRSGIHLTSAFLCTLNGHWFPDHGS